MSFHSMHGSEVANAILFILLCTVLLLKELLHSLELSLKCSARGQVTSCMALHSMLRMDAKLPYSSFSFLSSVFFVTALLHSLELLLGCCVRGKQTSCTTCQTR